ncbi:glycerophosphodiester phosphodiesterase family protein [Luteipulveratus sp. YIM 133132]|uniref:glycerophosphodiester phosphodiesterase n=1 Tax=Luteipulveratus flavus TaxID=3031728 RepID=UPI0023AF9E90|nr:glycerophosphodiester phosphodiesterase family protein [Luteipulveratus sp. YIM 133132]MDE9366538.1 glycerophosphodiester phosphodiesterase family protein [Luteipulveratus sp. YIM 133132]
MGRTLNGRAPLVVAHRGASAAEPEHTLRAYERAIRDGADAVECDVRLTADDELVCVHDRRVDRTSDGRGVVSDMRLADLLELDFGGPGGPGSTILLLRDLLDLLDRAPRRVDLAVETKHPARYGGRLESRLARLLHETGYATPTPDRPNVRMMSFSVLAVRRFGRLCPQLPRVLLAELGIVPSVRAGRLPYDVGAIGIGVSLLRRDPEIVDRHHARGHEVYVYTVDHEADLQRCFRSGVDAIITNRPAWVISVLGTR